MRIIKEAIAKTLKNRPESKVDWSNSPLKPIKDAGKNAVGDFGENLYALKVSGEVVKKAMTFCVRILPRKPRLKQHLGVSQGLSFSIKFMKSALIRGFIRIGIPYLSSLSIRTVQKSGKHRVKS